MKNITSSTDPNQFGSMSVSFVTGLFGASTDRSFAKCKSDRSFAGAGSGSTPPMSGHTNSSLTLRADARYHLDTLTVLKAFRIIGGFDGIEFPELRASMSKVRDVSVRQELEKNLDKLFQQYDLDADGVLNILEFERFLQASTFLQTAVYDLLDLADEEEREDLNPDEQVDPYINDFPLSRVLDIAAICTTLLNVGVLAIQVDISPDWGGWQSIELCFIGVFSLELIMRCALSCKHSKCCSNAFTNVSSLALTVIDYVIVVVGWIYVMLAWFDGEDSGAYTITHLWWVCPLRVVRCCRLARIFWQWHDFRIFLAGTISGIRAAACGIASIVGIALVWAVVIRTGMATRQASDGNLSDAFPSLPQSMLVVFRCMALSADGACEPGKSNESIFRLLYERFGRVYVVLWVASELFILVVILNVITSVIVMQTAENAYRIRQTIANASLSQDQARLQKLDRLLRSLIHPGREQSNPKEGHAAEVAKMIREQHPDAAAQIPNLETQLVHFARNIQEAKKVHQSAMDVYEAREATECRKLKGIPCAKSFVVDDEERLLVYEDASIVNLLSLPMAPLGAVEVSQLQESNDKAVLIEQAVEVQRFVKQLIFPSSEWAAKDDAGPSGPIWKQSRGLCDEVIDPGIKSLERIDKKVSLKYGGRYERNRDYSRLALIFDSVSHLIEAVPRMLDLRLQKDQCQVVTLENRFLQPHPLGWRDVTLLLKVNMHDPRKQGGIINHFMELQMRLRELAGVCHEGHTIYREIRAHLPEHLVATVLDRLVTDTTLELGITKSEWLQCLPNKEVKKLLDELGIPRRSFKRLFDVIDMDGSGTVTSSELQETIWMMRDQTFEIAGCHSRVREIQRLLNRYEPQLAMLNNNSLNTLTTVGRLFKKIAGKKAPTLQAFEFPQLPPDDHNIVESLPGSGRSSYVPWRDTLELPATPRTPRLPHISGSLELVPWRASASPPVSPRTPRTAYEVRSP